MDCLVNKLIMIKFNPKNKVILSYGEMLDPAMHIVDEREAREYFDDYVDFVKDYLKCNRKMATKIVKRKLRSWAKNYFPKKVRVRVKTLYNL